MNVNGGIEFWHAELFTPGDDGIGEGFKKEGHVCTGDDSPVFLDVLDAVDVQS